MSSLLVLTCKECGKGLDEGEITIKASREIFVEIYPCKYCLQEEYKKAVEVEQKAH